MTVLAPARLLAVAATIGLHSPAPAGECPLAVGAISIRGNQRTRFEVIERELACRPGDPARRLDCARIETHLRNLHLFSDVSVRAVSNDSLPGGDPCAVDLHIDVRERPAIWPFPIFSNTGKSGLSAGGGLAYRNLRGRNERLELAGQLGGVRGFSFAWANPWLAGNHLSAGLSTSYSLVRNRYDDFDEETFGVSTVLGTYLSADDHWRGSLGASYVSLRSQEAGKTISPDNHDRIHGASVALGYDTRDLYRNPRRGHQHLAAIGWFGQVLGGTVDYTQLMVDVRRFQPVPWGRTLAVGARWIRQTGTVPEYRQVRLGGSSTIRGYADGAVEGDHGAFGSIEWRFDLAPPVSRDLWLIENVDVGVSGALFADAGATWGRTENGGAADPLTWSDVATSFGAGLRLLVPWVEVVRADLAITESGRIAVVLGEGMKF